LACFLGNEYWKGTQKRYINTSTWTFTKRTVNAQLDNHRFEHTGTNALKTEYDKIIQGDSGENYHISRGDSIVYCEEESSNVYVSNSEWLQR
jgi:hypothetical protein